MRCIVVQTAESFWHCEQDVEIDTQLREGSLVVRVDRGGAHLDPEPLLECLCVGFCCRIERVLGFHGPSDPLSLLHLEVRPGVGKLRLGDCDGILGVLQLVLRGACHVLVPGLDGGLKRHLGIGDPGLCPRQFQLVRCVLEFHKRNLGVRDPYPGLGQFHRGRRFDRLRHGLLGPFELQDRCRDPGFSLCDLQVGRTGYSFKGLQCVSQGALCS